MPADIKQLMVCIGRKEEGKHIGLLYPSFCDRGSE